MDIASIKNFNNPATSVVPPHKPDKEKMEVEKFVQQRVEEMQDFRKELKLEERWREADTEYLPEELPLTKRKRFETDQTTGWRSRLVPVGDADQDWRSSNSDPVLLSKIQTAISIIIDNNPEATLAP